MVRVLVYFKCGIVLRRMEHEGTVYYDTLRCDIFSVVYSYVFLEILKGFDSVLLFLQEGTLGKRMCLQGRHMLSPGCSS